MRLNCEQHCSTGEARQEQLKKQHTDFRLDIISFN